MDEPTGPPPSVDSADAPSLKQIASVALRERAHEITSNKCDLLNSLFILTSVVAVAVVLFQAQTGFPPQPYAPQIAQNVFSSQSNTISPLTYHAMVMRPTVSPSISSRSFHMSAGPEPNCAMCFAAASTLYEWEAFDPSADTSAWWEAARAQYGADRQVPYGCPACDAMMNVGLLIATEGLAFRTSPVETSLTYHMYGKRDMDPTDPEGWISFDYAISNIPWAMDSLERRSWREMPEKISTGFVRMATLEMMAAMGNTSWFDHLAKHVKHAHRMVIVLESRRERAAASQWFADLEFSHAQIPHIQSLAFWDRAALPQWAVDNVFDYPQLRLWSDLFSKTMAENHADYPILVIDENAVGGETVSVWRPRPPVLDVRDAELEGPTGLLATPRAIQDAIAGAVGPADIDFEASVPASVDYRGHACMGPVRKQGACGSCWAFTTADLLTFQQCKSFGVKHVYSVQEMVSCNNHASGCQGANYPQALAYLHNRGVCTDSCQPYTNGQSAKTEPCRRKCADGRATVPRGAIAKPVGQQICMKNPSFPLASKACHIPTNIEAMKRALHQDGPLLSFMRVFASFRQWAKTHDVCTTTYVMSGNPYDDLRGYPEGHSILIVGYYSRDDGTTDWVVRNSWGAEWGCEGYFLVRAGQEKLQTEQEVILFDARREYGEP